MAQDKILAMILAGGKGERLMPLTEHRSKPAVPFAAKYRIVDFVLSNFLNSGIHAIYMLVQYRSQSLIEHVRRAWSIEGRLPQNFVSVVPPQMRAREGWYEGNADAVYQNLNLIRDFAPDVVAVFGADHIYRMDISQMVQFHHDHRADVTVAALPVPLHAATGFGIIEVSRESSPDQSHRIIGFEEKPKEPKPMPDDPEQAYSSMGNYLFNTDLLVQILERDANRPGSHDFGRDIVSQLITSHRVLAYNFCHNSTPGLHPYEERAYWRDVGTLEAYWQAHMDVLGEAPIFDLRNSQWQIVTDRHDGPPASLIRCRIDDSLIGPGARIVDADIRRSVIGRNVIIESGAQLDECIILNDAVVGSKSKLRRVIADRFNVIPAGSEIGYNAAEDKKHFQVGSTGLVVLPQGSRHRSRANRPTSTGSSLTGVTT
ncbi:MAG TPA: glucose-1-phosphate adenylyltransferase [Nitrospiraceae bacterium]|nr:glucose-1-phosphate adenylyltransferase [Nitrospiraceae bacterium]